MNIWARLAVVLALIGILLQQALIALFGLLVLLTYGLALLWSRWSLRAISYERDIVPNRIFPGETCDLILRLTNDGPLPLAWIKIYDSLNDHVTLLIREPVLPLEHTTSLLWYERVSWRYKMRARRRGRYRFDEVRLVSGDPFGIIPNEQIRSVYDYLLVYPRLLPLDIQALPARSPLGDVRAERQLFEDPTRLAGARPYQRDDPLKRIHWPATARTNRLQSKLYEYSNMREAVIMLNMMTFSGTIYNPNLELADRLVEAAAATMRFLLDERYAVGLNANAALYGGISPISVPPGRAEEQWAHLLETLALLIVIRRESFADLLLVQGTRLRWGTLIVIISAVYDEELGGAILQLKRAGHHVIIFSLNKRPPDWLSSIDVEYYLLEEHEGRFMAVHGVAV